mmetsp:Transcript_31377/g.86373  ORF Transcript_31377/g.86373 Transcript_31377/m.86373 type:complete len:253 (-) Transcript_31377:616-1374(-)
MPPNVSALRISRWGWLQRRKTRSGIGTICLACLTHLLLASGRRPSGPRALRGSRPMKERARKWQRSGGRARTIMPRPRTATARVTRPRPWMHRPQLLWVRWEQWRRPCRRRAPSRPVRARPMEPRRPRPPPPEQLGLAHHWRSRRSMTLLRKDAHYLSRTQEACRSFCPPRARTHLGSHLPRRAALALLTTVLGSRALLMSDESWQEPVLLGRTPNRTRTHPLRSRPRREVLNRVSATPRSRCKSSSSKSRR